MSVRIRQVRFLLSTPQSLTSQLGRQFVTDGGVLCAMQDPVVTRTTSFELGVSSVVQARKAPREIRSREIIRMKGESYITGKWKPLVLPGRIIEYGAVIKVPMSKELKHAELSNCEYVHLSNTFQVCKADLFIQIQFL